MKKITMALVGLMTLFVTSNVSAQGWINPTINPDPATDGVAVVVSYTRDVGAGNALIILPDTATLEYCFGAACDVATGTSVTTDPTGETSSSQMATFSTTIPGQAEGTIVRWRVVRIGGIFGDQSPIEEYTVQAAGDNCNIIDAATIGATDITMTTATITFTPAATGADGSVPDTAQILVFRASGSTVDFNQSGVDVSQTSGGTVAATGLMPGTEYNVRFLSQTCSGTTTVPDGSTTITDAFSVFTTLPACDAPTGTPTILNITDTTADVLFSFGGANDPVTWEWIAVAQGDPATGTVLASGSQPVAGSSSVAVSGLSPGTDYSIYVRGVCGDSSITEYIVNPGNFTTTGTLGVDDLSIKNVSVFPNPARSQVRILGVNSIDNVTVYNMLGAKMFSTDQTVINTSNLKAGLYLLQIESDGANATKRLIIQ